MNEVSPISPTTSIWRGIIDSGGCCLNENPYPPSPKVLKAIFDSARNGNRYREMASGSRAEITKISIGSDNVFLETAPLKLSKWS
jgi:histidinol-phosphate/aromatic aminotransferase/cobyric acid decarboxylase-like protein